MDGGGNGTDALIIMQKEKKEIKAQEEGAKDGRREEKGGKIQLQCGANFTFDETKLRVFLDSAKFVSKFSSWSEFINLSNWNNGTNNV